VSRASLALASVLALAMFAPDARAGDVARVKLGGEIRDLVTAPDGGAWIATDGPRRQAGIIRASPDGSVRTARTSEVIADGELGPDGQAWFQIDSGSFVRSNPQGVLTTVGKPTGPAGFSLTFAAGPDGTMWSPTPEQTGIAHLSAAGALTVTPGGLPKPCRDGAILVRMVRAADGAMWIADSGCERLVRVSPAGTTTVSMPVELGDPYALAPDANGGVWTTGEFARVAHADAAGHLETYELPDHLSPTEVAVALDGSAWFATGECRLARVTLAGDVTHAPAPIPARRLGFDPAGGMWLASAARLVHVAAGEGFGPCDDEPPAVRVSPGAHGSVSLRALRRAGGFRITADGPAIVRVYAGYSLGTRKDSDFKLVDALEKIVHRGSVRYRLSAAVLRRLAHALDRGRSPTVILNVDAADAEGLHGVDENVYTVRR
jgi:streptogramin lyase